MLQVGGYPSTKSDACQISSGECLASGRRFGSERTATSRQFSFLNAPEDPLQKTHELFSVQPLRPVGWLHYM